MLGVEVPRNSSVTRDCPASSKSNSSVVYRVYVSGYIEAHCVYNRRIVHEVRNFKKRYHGKVFKGQKERDVKAMETHDWPVFLNILVTRHPGELEVYSRAVLYVAAIVPLFGVPRSVIGSLTRTHILYRASSKYSMDS
jgi:hypothetical protein